MVAMAIGSLGWFVALALRVGTPDGQELAGRTATFVYIPVSLVAGLALIRLVNAALARRWESAAIAVAVTGTLMLLFDGLSNGWPPYWERLPGPHQVAGFERSVGPEEIAAAQWTLTALGPGTGSPPTSAATRCSSGYGDQNPLQGTGYLYTTRAFTPGYRAGGEGSGGAVRAGRPAAEPVPSGVGQLFPRQLDHRQPADTDRRPDQVQPGPGAARVYDNGDIVIYDLQGAQSAP